MSNCNKTRVTYQSSAKEHDQDTYLPFFTKSNNIFGTFLLGHMINRYLEIKLTEKYISNDPFLVLRALFAGLFVFVYGYFGKYFPKNLSLLFSFECRFACLVFGDSTQC